MPLIVSFFKQRICCTPPLSLAHNWHCSWCWRNLVSSIWSSQGAFGLPFEPLLVNLFQRTCFLEGPCSSDLFLLGFLSCCRMSKWLIPLSVWNSVMYSLYFSTLCVYSGYPLLVLRYQSFEVEPILAVTCSTSHQTSFSQLVSKYNKHILHPQQLLCSTWFTWIGYFLSHFCLDPGSLPKPDIHHEKSSPPFHR